MKSTAGKIIKLLFFFLIISFLNSCCSTAIKLVNPETKVAFGIAFTAPSQAILFVENENVSASKNKIETHTETANSIYNNYGPATDKRFIGRTNARQLKFSTKDKTYFIDITEFKHRTAMILFDGKSKPIIEYHPKKYEKLFLKYFYSSKNQ